MEKREKILTIKIAACGVEPYIRQCLNTFANHKYDGILEVLVVVNECADCSLEISREYEKEYPLIFQVIENGKNNYASTYNVGFQRATGKYWTSLDGDDFFESDAFEEYLDLLSKCDSDLVVNEWLQFDGKGGVKHKKHFGEYEENREYLFEEICLDISFVEIFSLTVKTSIIKKNRINIDEVSPFASDVKTCMYIIPYVQTVSFFQRELRWYRRHGEQATSNVDILIRSQNSFEDACERVLFFLKKMPELSESKRIYLERRAARLEEVAFRNTLLLPMSRNTMERVKNLRQKLINENLAVYERTGRSIQFINSFPFLAHILLAQPYKIYKRNAKWLIV